MTPVHSRSRPTCHHASSGPSTRPNTSASRSTKQPRIARGRTQERHRRQKQQSRRQHLRQRTGKMEADHRSDMRGEHEAAGKPVAERDAAFARPRRQEAQRFHPHAHCRQMGRQQQFPVARRRRLDERQQRHHHGKQPHAAQADRQRNLDQRRTAPKRRDQDDLPRPDPHQQGRQHDPNQAEAEIVCQRADPDIGADQAHS